jgi:trehalose 6-phosphate synthase
VAVRVYPISIDVEILEHDAREADVGRLRRELIGKLDGRKLLLRVDRAELSKNILRGFQAFGIFLQRYPNWQGKVSFLAQLNPSREDVPGYGEYIEDCVAAADGINERFGTADWQPVEVMLKDDFPHTLAAYRLYDVLLVNPVFDGMNLVAKEGPVLNRNDGVLVLSENAGAFFELGDNAVVVNPFDLVATAEAIRIGLEMDPAERSRRAKALRRAVRRNRLARWVQAQLRDLDRATSRG